MPNNAISILYACRMLLIAALRLVGLPDATYEMNSAVALALTTPDAEARWLSGENIFKSLPIAPPPPPQFEESIRQLAAFVAPTI